MSLSPADAESIGGYALVRRLGSGGMGVVYLGRSASGRQVAVKVVHPQYALDEEFRARFRQEVAAARRVSGAFTAPVVDADPEAELPWMATLYVPGRTLAEIVAKDGPLGGQDLANLALGLVEALRDIHRAGVVHRDLKPSNVLMAEDGPRVIDFGISRAVDNEALTVTGRLIGTPPFMSPEQFASPRDVTGASDVFSLGSLLVYAATGNRPFDGGSPYTTGFQVMYEQPALDGVQEPLRSVVERCLAKDPAARPELAELHRMLRALPGTAAPMAPGTTDPAVAPGTADQPMAPAAADRAGSRHRAAPAHAVPRQVAAAPRTGGTGGTDGTDGSRTGHRRRVWRILISLAATLAVTGLSITAVKWGQHRASASHPSTASASPTGGPSTPELPAGWQPWRASLSTAVKGEPVDDLASGCVPDKNALYCAGTGFTVAKIDAATGRVLWRYGTSPQTSRPVGVRNGLVYVYEKPPDALYENATYLTRRLVALDADTRQRRWSRLVSEDRPAYLFSRGVLTMSKDAKKFVAYDESGRELWTAPAQASAGNTCIPGVLDGAPYGLCTPDDPARGSVSLLRFDPADGTRHEIAPLPAGTQPLGVVGGRPLLLVPQDVEYVSDGGEDEPYKQLLSVDPSSGAVERIPLTGTARGSATLTGGVVYFVRPNGTVTAVRAANGKRLWQKSTDGENLSAPVASRRYGDLYFTNRYGRLLALDRDTGAPTWHTTALENPGGSVEDTTPSVLLVEDAIVAVVGETAFSVRPDRPTARPSLATAG
ncbi:PQQ-binding-like beta-propeller repeat protein [Streptomyces sp. NPDC050287]|uniref:protein kinase domain-containing protein n=1 Tax=Streptomyces sp. NPDC050287 TaxID=3365608 RepID=UPI0037BDD0EC